MSKAKGEKDSAPKYHRKTRKVKPLTFKDIYRRSGRSARVFSSYLSYLRWMPSPEVVEAHYQDFEVTAESYDCSPDDAWGAGTSSEGQPFDEDIPDSVGY